MNRLCVVSPSVINQYPAFHEIARSDDGKGGEMIALLGPDDGVRMGGRYFETEAEAIASATASMAKAKASNEKAFQSASFHCGPSRRSDKRWAFVAVAQIKDSGKSVCELRNFIGCWPYETAWMSCPGGATVLSHEGDAIAAALVSKGWTRV